MINIYYTSTHCCYGYHVNIPYQHMVQGELYQTENWLWTPSPLPNSGNHGDVYSNKRYSIYLLQFVEWLH